MTSQYPNYVEIRKHSDARRIVINLSAITHMVELELERDYDVFEVHFIGGEKLVVRSKTAVDLHAALGTVKIGYAR